MRRNAWSLGRCCWLLALWLLVACNRSTTPQIPAATSLGQGAPVAISPDGNRLLVIRAKDELNEGWLQPTDGGAGQKILEFTSTTFYAAFSPDGQHLVWSSDALWLANADGSNAKSILAEATGAVAWSPDSQQLAVAVEDSIKRVDLQGKELAVVTEAESIQSLVWARLPSGERLLFVSYPSDQPAYVASVRQDGQDLVRLADAEAFDLAGERLYLAEPLSAGPLRWQELGGGGNATATKLVDSGVVGVSARPPGYLQVAYVLQSEDATGSDLWLVGADGQKRQQLTSGAPVLSQLWSPDGQRLYYAVFNAAAEETEDPFQVMVITVP